MSSGYVLLGAFFVGAMLFVGVGYLVSRLLQSQKPNEQKLAPYECGEESQDSGQSVFNFRFQFPALIFLLFEVEIVLLSPILLAQNHPGAGFTQDTWFFQIKLIALVFVGLLGLGFVLALALGYLDWDKPEMKPVVFEGPIPDWAYEQANLTFERSQIAVQESNPGISPVPGT